MKITCTWWWSSPGSGWCGSSRALHQTPGCPGSYCKKNHKLKEHCWLLITFCRKNAPSQCHRIWHHQSWCTWNRKPIIHRNESKRNQPEAPVTVVSVGVTLTIGPRAGHIFTTLSTISTLARHPGFLDSVNLSMLHHESYITQTSNFKKSSNLFFQSEVCFIFTLNIPFKAKGRLFK